MKFAIALALLPSAFGSITFDDFKANSAETSSAIMKHAEKVHLDSLHVAPKEATLTYMEKALRSIRGLYTVYVADDDQAQELNTPKTMCSYNVLGITDGCFSGTGTVQGVNGMTYKYGACASCFGNTTSGDAYDFETACYTCNAGYTLMTVIESPVCMGACVKNDDFSGSGFEPIATSDCLVFGGCYPITCNAAGTDGSCPAKSVTASCFSGSDTVTLESGASKALSEVRVGDMILSADAKGELSFSGVVALPHGANADAATFFDVATASGKHVKATEMHLLKTCSGALAYAGSLKQGDCLRTVDGDEAIVSVETVQGKGLYTVVTMNEFPVIGGIVASPFAVTHGFGNAYYNIHRALYKFAPALMQSSAVASANALVGTAVMLAAGFFNSGSN